MSGVQGYPIIHSTFSMGPQGRAGCGQVALFFVPPRQGVAFTHENFVFLDGSKVRDPDRELPICGHCKALLSPSELVRAAQAFLAEQEAKAQEIQERKLIRRPDGSVAEHLPGGHLILHEPGTKVD